MSAIMWQAPVSKALFHLCDALAWAPGSDIVSPVLLKRRDNARRGLAVDTVPRTLVCHDMCGGYIVDRFIQGVNKAECYRIYHWQYIDIFVYFSHHLVTIPPPCWISAAHKHGVPCLGTFITEHDAGYEICKEFLSDESSYLRLANQLVDIAVYYNFDGWLMNIENKVDVDRLPALIKFLSVLRATLKRKIPHGQMIWYDSVIKTGELKWQDELNENNGMFFEVADAIFLNYCWNEEKLKRSKLYASQTGRQMDVYVGIDVFGRGLIGGGGFKTNEAVSLARKEVMSIAIFAPGWVFQNLPQKQFQQNNDRFWNLLSDCMITHGVESQVLSTHLCQGYGKKFHWNGQPVFAEEWFNMSLQSLQATYTESQFHHRGSDVISNSPHNSTDIDMISTDSDSFIGGSCLRLSGMISSHRPQLEFKLFSCDILLQEDFLVCYTTKTETAAAEIYLQLDIVATSNNSKSRSIVLCSKEHKRVCLHNLERMTAGQSDLLENGGYVAYDEPCSDDEVVTALKEHSCCLNTDVRENWNKRYFVMRCDETKKGSRIMDVSICMERALSQNAMVSCLLGQLQIIPLSTFDRPLPTIRNLHYTHTQQCKNMEDHHSKAVLLRLCQQNMPVHTDTDTDNTRNTPVQDAHHDQCTQLDGWLVWDCDRPGDIEFYNVYVYYKSDDAWEYIGSVENCMYKVATLQHSILERGNISFRIQPLFFTGFWLPLEMCSSCTVTDTVAQ